MRQPIGYAGVGTEHQRRDVRGCITCADAASRRSVPRNRRLHSLAASPPTTIGCPAYTGAGGNRGSPVTITGRMLQQSQLNKGNAILEGTIVLTGDPNFNMATLTSGTSGVDHLCYAKRHAAEFQ